MLAIGILLLAGGGAGAPGEEHPVICETGGPKNHTKVDCYLPQGKPVKIVAHGDLDEGCKFIHTNKDQPGTVQGMMAIEKLFFDFSAKIPEVRAENYWNRLKKLKMLSQERRMERYRVLYIWKIIEKKTPNCGIELAPQNERLGRRCAVPPLQKNGRTAIQTLREQSL